jgi:hypothetical protein
LRVTFSCSYNVIKLKSRRPIEEFSTQLIEKEQAIHGFSTQVVEKEQAVQAFAAQVADHEQALRTLSAQMAAKDGELKRITGTLGWRLLGLYGKIKYRYLLPVYRLLHLMPPEPKVGDEEPVDTGHGCIQMRSSLLYNTTPWLSIA